MGPTQRDWLHIHFDIEWRRHELDRIELKTWGGSNEFGAKFLALFSTRDLPFARIPMPSAADGWVLVQFEFLKI
jgi:hypothetical protein